MDMGLIWILRLIISMLILRIVFVATDVSPWIVDALLSLVIAREIYRWKLGWSSNPMLWILYIALLWVPLAFTISAISNALSFFNDTYFLFLDVHVLLLGFLFTVLIGFG